MSALRARAPGKVNLALFLGRGRDRPDGRHALVTLIESVSLADELTLTLRADGEDAVVCPGVEGRNLAGDALAALRAAGWDAPPVRIEIAKRVPVAAGMGGGSADAAATLRLAGAVARPGPETDVLEIAAALGADVPSQLEPGVWLGHGAGEAGGTVPALAPHTLVVVPSAAALSTAAVYREADRLGLGRPADQLAQLREELASALAQDPRPLPGRLLVNDLEPATISLCPPVADALAAARATGADHAFVCGSGPTVAGLFWGAGTTAATDAAAALQTRYPGATAVEPVTAAYGAPRAG